MPDNKYTFFLPYDDNQVRQMLEKRGHDYTFEAHASWDILLLTGGADITPFLYGERKMDCTHPYMARDLLEVSAVKNVPEYDRMKVGICRGAQLLNVLCGGKLYQDVDNHARRGMHPVLDIGSNTIINVTSCHHQMMIPTNDAYVIATAKESYKKRTPDWTKTYTKESREEEWDDPEVVHYFYNNALCFQGHPEYGLKSCTEYFFELVDTYFVEPKGLKKEGSQ